MPLDGAPRRDTILYDGECALCRAAVKVLGHDERAAEARSFRDPAVLRAHPSVDPAACEAALQLVRADGTVLTGAAAVVAIAGSRWWGRPLRRAYAWAPLRRVIDASYAWVARHRHGRTLQKLAR